jgi:hypothetical protein
MNGSNIVAKHVPGDLLRAKTFELRDDLRAEGVIEAPRVVYSSSGGAYRSTRLHDDEREAIAAFLASKGPRRFADHDSGDDFNLCVFLTGRGHKIQRNCSIGSRRAPFFIDEKPYSRAGFIAFVNRARAALSLQPIGLPA